MLGKAKRLQEEAAKYGFDWDTIEGVFLKIEEELSEIKQAYKANDRVRLSQEIGDLLFCVVNLSRHLGVDPNLCLSSTIKKFRERFKPIKEILKERKLSLTQMDELWEIQKSKEL